ALAAGALLAAIRSGRRAVGPELTLVGAGLLTLPALALLPARAAVTAGLALFALPILRGMLLRILPFLAWAHAFGDRPRRAPPLEALSPRAGGWAVATFGLVGGLTLVAGTAAGAWGLARLGAASLLLASVLQVGVALTIGWRTWRHHLRAGS